MAENIDPIPKPTLTRVRVDDPYEVRRWCQRFVCTERQLRDAVARVGDDPEAVNAELHRAR